MPKSHIEVPVMLSAVSLFSGAGGMDIGFEAAGFQVEWANDLDPVACATYALNLGRKIAVGPIEEYVDSVSKFSDVDLVFGGPPCQGFSVAGKMDPEDTRSSLIWRFFDVIERVRPAAFVCENVKALGSLTKWERVRRRMFERAETLGYSYGLVILNSREFGVSQSRERMFLIGTRSRNEFHSLGQRFSTYRKKPSPLRELLRTLGPAGSANNSRVCNAKVTIASSPVMRKSPYAGMMFNGQGRPLNPDGVSSTLHASMGGNKTPILDELHLHFGAESWVEEYHAHLMRGGKPLPFEGAPERLRRLTVDEAIRIQSFPSHYQFLGTQGQVFRQVGNAVPCGLAEAVGSVARELLMGGRRYDEIQPQMELELERAS
jgi:DNA (cytosine-5)-methyltransferase 1